MLQQKKPGIILFNQKTGLGQAAGKNGKDNIAPDVKYTEYHKM